MTDSPDRTLRGRSTFAGVEPLCIAGTQSDRSPNASALYRLFNPATGDHLYTTSGQEVEEVTLDGYQTEGIVCWVLPG